MKTNRPIRTAMLVGLATIALASCGKKTPAELPPAPEGTTSGDLDGNLNGGGANSVGYGPDSQEAFVAAAGSDRILFDTDRYNIDAEDQQVLTAQAQWLQAHPAVRAVIEGHADERGTRDYNLALGERRANAARAYLSSLGVEASRLQTVSYGKERPQATGSDEESWAQNRRAVTVTVR